ncbi:acyl-CoA dehydrogenase family protein [Streptomyces sp. NPDC005329]|uniref:acyl-CoA dehydrogenase family protein n=1 Tax=Streptomyces sp. NPDC005329 TaxID=3157034 RepID=UPI0033A8C8CD
MSTQSGFLEAARAAGETAARRAAAADADRRLHPEVAEALVEAGFTRRFVPESLGGEPVSYAAVTTAVASVGEGCASAAWIASLLAHTGRFATYLPENGQAEVWEKGPDTRLVTAVVPQGSAEPVEGGWRVSGTWSYVSGVDFADWALVLGPGPGQDGTGSRFFAVRRSDFTVLDTWHTLGMRGTGSHSITLDGVFVPEQRSFPREDLFSGEAGPHVPALNAVPLFSVNGLTFGAPVLGAARGALALAAERLGTGNRPAKESTRTAFARASAEADAAGLLLERIARTADEGCTTPDLVARSRRDSAYAAQALAGAVNLVFHGNGVRGQDRSDPLQRYWRDVQGAVTHGVLQFEPAALEYTASLVRTD